MQNLTSPYSRTFELRGPRLRLSRLRLEDVEEVVGALFDYQSWFVKDRGLSSPELLAQRLNQFYESQQLAEKLTFVARFEGQVVAMSTYHNPMLYQDRLWGLEIGFTWVATRWQRTFVNTEMKYLMLGHAFEVLRCKRVQFAVDPDNGKSNTAVTRLGAVLEGCFRRYRPFSDGDIGDRNIYSIISDEWTHTKKALESKLIISN